jgi:hypothetical protein
MTTDNSDSTQLDAVATTGGKATVETTQHKPRSRFAADAVDLLFSARDHTRDDTLVGEIVRICLQLDKAGFAKVYAMVKAEEALMDARHRRRLETITQTNEESSS